MGTTLHAIVEVLEPAVPQFEIAAHWTDVCHWDFGKSYTIMIGLREAIYDGWPRDPSHVAQRWRDRGTADTGLMWGEPEHMPGLHLEGYQREYYTALLDTLAAFKRPVRVLFYSL